MFVFDCRKAVAAFYASVEVTGLENEVIDMARNIATKSMFFFVMDMR